MSSPAEAVAPPSDASPVAEDTPGIRAFSSAARVGGAVIALGYLLGLVPGTLGAATGALALLTFGRSLADKTTRPLVGLSALGVIALAVAVGGLRWASSSLDAIRGAQAVLGPTLLIAPQEAAIGVGLAAGAGIVALALWLSVERPSGILSWAVSCLEGAVAALLLVTAFWGPAVVARAGGGAGGLAGDAGAWALAVVAALLPSVGLSLAFRRLSVVWSWVALAAGLAAALAGTIVVPSFVAR